MGSCLVKAMAPDSIWGCVFFTDILRLSKMTWLTVSAAWASLRPEPNQNAPFKPGDRGLGIQISSSWVSGFYLTGGGEQLKLEP